MGHLVGLIRRKDSLLMASAIGREKKIPASWGRKT